MRWHVRRQVFLHSPPTIAPVPHGADPRKEVSAMKKITVRKAGSVRLTTSPAYWPPCF